MCLQDGQLLVEHSNRGFTVIVDGPTQSATALVSYRTRDGMADRTVQEWLVSTHLVLELADLPDDGFTSLDPLFCSGQGEIVRLGR